MWAQDQPCIAAHRHTLHAKAAHPHSISYGHMFTITAGNGFPMAAVVTNAHATAAFANGMEFFATTGGCNAATAAGAAVLQVGCSLGTRVVRCRLLQCQCC